MSCRCAPCLVMLDDAVTAQFPGRDQSSDGCCGDAAHASRKSDHNPDASGYAHAIDIDEDVVTTWGDRELWGFGILLLSDPRCKYVIYEQRILYPDGTDNAYTGVNAHQHHLHLSIKAGTEKDMRPWPKVPEPGGGDDLTKDEHDQLNLIFQSIARQETQQGRIEVLLQRIATKLGA